MVRALVTTCADDVVGQGDVDFDVVFRANARQVAMWAMLLGGPAVDANDVVQDVFIVVQKKLPEFREEARITTWLYRITANVVRHHRRRSKLLAWLQSRASLESSVGSPDTPLEELERLEARRTVYRALEGMKHHHREVFVLFELEGVTGGEIARRLEIQEATVWVRLGRARKEFAARVEKLAAQENRLRPNGGGMGSRK
ncbi:MAG: sigma-70 family RNA polymerase sigma factor [Deltaproteobacteria bacterium]|nr:sigma-70 family RNA polymerase sigma factor [Deltaproteobacteria bacterium]